MALTVSDLLTRQVLTVAPDTTLAVAAKLMAEKHFSCLIAVDDGKPVGILTESDLVRIGYMQLDPTKRGIAEFLSQPVISVTTNQSIYEAFDFLLEHHVRHLVATHADGTLDGLLTFSDILKAAEFDDFLRVKKISSVMSRKVMTLAPDDSVLKGMEVMTTMHISCVVVVEDGKGLGIFSERDAANLVAAGTDLKPLLLADVMTTPLKTTREDESLLNAYLMMREQGFRRMVIADESDKPIGIITQFDVIRGMEGNTIRHYKKLHAKTEEKLAESQKLLAEKSELERIVAASPSVLYRCTWDGDVEHGEFHPTYFSPQISPLLGYESSDFLRPDWWKIHVHPDDQDEVHACLQKITQTGERDLVYRVGTKSGEWLWIMDHGRVSKDADGTPLEMVGSWLDITERRQTELELSEKEDRYYRLFNEARDMMHIVGVDGRIIDVNQMELDTLGYTREEMIGMPVMELICLEFQEETSKRIKGVFAGELHPLAETALRKKDGGCIDVEVSATPQYDADGVIIAGRAIIRDISERKQAEKALLTSRARLDFALQGADDGLWDWNLETNGVYYSPRWKAMLGYKEDELGNTLDVWAKLVDPAQKEEVLSHAQAYIDGKSSKYEVEFRMRHKDGHWVDILARARLAVDADGKPLTPPRLVGTHVDISERKAAENKLKASEEKYRRMIESSYDAIFVAETETGILINANEQAEKMIGLPRSRIIGRHQSELHPPEEKERYKQLFFDNVKDDRAFMPDLLVRRADGSDVPVDISANVTEVNGIGIVQAVFRDISERKAAESELKASEEKYRRMIESSNDAIFVADVESEILIDVNEQAEKMLGLPREKIIGMHQGQLHPPEELARYKKIFADHSHEERSFIPDVVVRRADGRDVPVDISANKTEIAGRQVLQGVFRDVSERKAAEEKLRLAYFSLDQAGDAVYWMTPVGDFVYVNEAASKMLGYSRDSLLRMGVADIDPSLPDGVPSEMAQSTRDVGFARIETKHRSSDGRLIPVEVVIGVIDFEGRDHHCAFVRDITQRLKQEEQMRLLKSAVASVNESIIITDSEGVIVYVNPSFTKNTGFSTEDALGNTPAILNSKQQSKGFYEQFWKTLKDGKAWSGRIFDRKKDGTIFPVHLSVAPIFDEKQIITHFVAVHDDLSEAESMQKQVMQSQKMEAVGTMVGGVAHDFNNLLASIVGNLYLMRNHHKDDARTVARIRSMESSMQHGAQLIQQMLTFARKDRTDMHAMDLKVFMKEAHKLAHASVPENISFRLDYPRSDEMWIKGDAGQLQQVLLNLVTNAQHAVSGCEKPEIEVKLAVVRPESDSRLVARFPEMANEEAWCCLSCSDNGCGMNAGLLERVFEPFFTTKPVGEGTGLGLSMVYGAVQNHRGFIDLQSEPDKGTQVSIYLPLYSAEPVEIRGHDEAVVDGAGFTILLVDDEESLRQVLAEVLRHSGFSVLQAVDGEQAVEVFETQQSEIDLVLMDVVMPNKGGVTAAKEIRDIDATVPIIFQTGYGEATQLEAAASISHSDAIQKPVEIPLLMELIMRRVSR